MPEEKSRLQNMMFVLAINFVVLIHMNLNLDNLFFIIFRAQCLQMLLEIE